MPDTIKNQMDIASSFTQQKKNGQVLLNLGQRIKKRRRRGKKATEATYSLNRKEGFCEPRMV